MQQFPKKPLFFWFLAFLVWVEVTGILIPWSPFLSFIWTAVHHFNSYSHLLAVYRLKSLNDVPVYIIPLSVHTTQSLDPGSKLCIMFHFDRVGFEALTVLIFTSKLLWASCRFSMTPIGKWWCCHLHAKKVIATARSTYVTTLAL